MAVTGGMQPTGIPRGSALLWRRDASLFPMKRKYKHSPIAVSYAALISDKRVKILALLTLLVPKMQPWSIHDNPGPVKIALRPGLYPTASSAGHFSSCLEPNISESFVKLGNAAGATVLIVWCFMCIGKREEGRGKRKEKMKEAE